MTYEDFSRENNMSIEYLTGLVFSPDSWNLLHISAYYRNSSWVEWVLKNGRNEQKRATDEAGNKPVDLSVIVNDGIIMNLLIDENSNNHNLLKLAVLHNATECFEQLTSELTSENEHIDEYFIIASRAGNTELAAKIDAIRKDDNLEFNMEEEGSLSLAQV